MHKSNHHAIRMVLQQYQDGLSVLEIAERTEKPISPVYRALKEMPDTYIDRWVSHKEHKKQWAAIWCVVVPPEDCPKPN